MATEKLSTPNATATAVKETSWLDGEQTGNWKTVTFKGNMGDPKERDVKEKIIKAYIRGWLELHNDEVKDEVNEKYKLNRVEIRNNYGGDTRFNVKAFIEPLQPDNTLVSGNGNDNVSPEGGGHLIPPPPPPPNDL